jgi:hypothetical protein
MSEMKTNLRRKVKTPFDSGVVDSNSYSDSAGAQKVVKVGPFLRPIDSAPTSLTTDASTLTRLSQKGMTLAIYNNDTAVHSITVSDGTVASGLAAGVVSGIFVGVPCPPAQYTYINTYQYDYIMTDSNKLLVFIVEDDTNIRI